MLTLPNAFYKLVCSYKLQQLHDNTTQAIYGSSPIMNLLLPHDFGAVCNIFVCVWNISRTAEPICAKYTQKMCLVRRSGKFEYQSQRSKIGVLADMSGIAELICDKFTRKTCLIPHSDEFGGQRPRSPGTKNNIFRPFWQPTCSLCLVKHL